MYVPPPSQSTIEALEKELANEKWLKETATETAAGIQSKLDAEVPFMGPGYHRREYQWVSIQDCLECYRIPCRLQPTSIIHLLQVAAHKGTAHERSQLEQNLARCQEEIAGFSTKLSELDTLHDALDSLQRAHQELEATLQLAQKAHACEVLQLTETIKMTKMELDTSEGKYQKEYNERR